MPRLTYICRNPLPSALLQEKNVEKAHELTPSFNSFAALFAILSLLFLVSSLPKLASEGLALSRRTSISTCLAVLDCTTRLTLWALRAKRARESASEPVGEGRGGREAGEPRERESV